jgi:hypothetical protein
MRTQLALITATLLAACGGGTGSGGDVTNGAPAQAVTVAGHPSLGACVPGVSRPPGAIAVEEQPGGRVMVRIGGVPFCEDSIAAVTNFLSVPDQIHGPLAPASSDPMPADGTGNGTDPGSGGTGSGGKGGSVPMPAKHN